MELELKRTVFQEECTIGELRVDDAFQCYMLEDKMREVQGQSVAKWKIKGQTAVPCGRFRVVLTHSDHFGRVLPLLLDVPGYSGVRIHPGNKAADTEGCLLTGQQAKPELHQVWRSAAAFEELNRKLHAAIDQNNEEVWITIYNKKEE